MPEKQPSTPHGTFVLSLKPEYIPHEANNPDAWVCVCGNHPDYDGFYPCDEFGNEMVPSIGSNWQGLYVCGRCGRVIDQQNMAIIGRNPDFKMLD